MSRSAEIIENLEEQIADLQDENAELEAQIESLEETMGHIDSEYDGDPTQQLQQIKDSLKDTSLIGNTIYQEGDPVAELNGNNPVYRERFRETFKQILREI